MDQDDWQPINTQSSSENDDWTPVSAPQQSNQSSLGEDAFTGVGLAGRALFEAVPKTIAGAGDLVNSGINAGTSALNKYAGTNIPQLGMPTDTVDKLTTATGMFPVPKDSTQEGVQNIASLLLGGGEGGYNLVKEAGKNALGYATNVIKAPPMAMQNVEDQAVNALFGSNKPKPLPKLDPTDIVREHASSLDAARNVGGEISQNMEKVAGNDTVVAPQAQEHVQALLDQVKQNEFPVKNKAQAVKILNGVLDNFGDNGEMQVTDAMKISKLANESYDPTNVQYKGYWGNAKSAADDVMDAYSAQNPHFSALRDLQRDHYANNVGNAFEDNGVAQKYFDKQDFQNVKNTDEGKIDYLNPDTQAKMDSMIGRVRTANDYTTLRRGINDPDVAQQFDNAVAEKIMPGRAKLFWEGVRGSVQRGEVPSKGSVVQGALRAAFPESSMSPEEVGIMNAMKEANTAPTKSSTFANKQASDSIMQDWAAKQTHDAQLAAQTDAYNRMNTKLLPSPVNQINVPEGGFAVAPNEEMGSLDINYNPSQRALPRPKEMTYEDMQAAGRILPNPETVPMAMPSGAIPRTYNPNDLNVSGDIAVPETKVESNPVIPATKTAPAVNLPKKWTSEPELSLGKQQKPYSFFDVIRKAGGIRPQGAENLTNVIDVGSAPRGLVKPGGMTHEQALNLGIREGFIKDNGQGINPTSNDLGDLYSALENGNKPHPQFAGQSSDAAYRANLESEADKRGIEHKGLPNEQIVQELNSHEAAQGNQNAYETSKSSGSSAKASRNVQGNEQPKTSSKNAGVSTKSVGILAPRNEPPQSTFGNDEIPFAKGGIMRKRATEFRKTKK